MRAGRLASFFMCIIFLVPHFANADALSPDEHGVPGVTEGEGTTFQIIDSDYLNIGLSSTKTVKLRMESMPHMIVMNTESSSVVASTQITLTGLVASTTYYKYEDNYHNLAPFVSDENGTYSYTQDISEAHVIFIQSKKSTKFIHNDETGGDCSSFGTWDPATLICTLATDLAETVEIDSDGITLDGGGHATNGSDTGVGVYIDSKSDVTVKNLVIKNFSYGIYLNTSSRSVMEANTFLNNFGAGIFFNSDNSSVRDNAISGDSAGYGFLFFDSRDSEIVDNTFSSIDRALFLYDSSHNNAITGNTFSGSSDCLFLYESYDNTITDNVFSGAARALFLFDSYDNTISKNTLSDSEQALFVYQSSHDNAIYHNNFINNGTNAIDYSDGTFNAFNLPKPYGGNYFDAFDEPVEGCEDENLDGICDAPYVFNTYFNGGQDNLPWTTRDGWGDIPVVIPDDYSSVLFLPGIEGSRLYEGTGCGKDAEEKLWEPIGDSLLSILRGAGDEKVRGLFLDQDGVSVCSDIYAKEDDIIDSVRSSKIYQSFIDEMNGLEADGTIADWKPVAYDWRLSLDDLLNNGAEREGKIYFTEATSTPYIEQTLRALAGSSKTGKVTIVAHSNGGLVAKALLNQLGGETPKLVDKVIMVGVPQSGAPIATGALLYGLDQGISYWGISILHTSVARELAQNSPMAYHLLPSQDYFDSVMDGPNHPIARFAGDGYTKEISAYGNAIGTVDELDDFLLASTTLNSSLIDYANVQHSVLDSWTPPEGIEVNQIAGWGADTVAGIDFYTSSGISVLSSLAPVRMYRPIFTEDGDGTVPVPSALMMTSGTNVKRYWVNLFSYNNETNSNRKHKDLFEIPSLEDFIKNIIKNSTSTLPAYISTTQPPTETENKKLAFFLHSPLTLQLTDSEGNITGLATDDSITENIPDSTYGEFGEVKYIIVPEGSSYQLTMYGQASGTFSLDIQEISDGVVTTSSTIENVPTTASTFASLTISGGIETASTLSVDENGDGKNIITITPKVGETVNYEPPAPAPEPEPEPIVITRSRGKSKRIQITDAVLAPVTTNTVDEIAKPSVATSAPEVVVQAKKEAPMPIAKSKKIVPIQKDTELNIPQTASVYDASQHPSSTGLGAMIYNGLSRFWTALKKLF